MFFIRLFTISESLLPEALVISLTSTSVFPDIVVLSFILYVVAYKFNVNNDDTVNRNTKANLIKFFLIKNSSFLSIYLVMYTMCLVRQFNVSYPPFKKNSRIYLLNEINTANHQWKDHSVHENNHKKAGRIHVPRLRAWQTRLYHTRKRPAKHVDTVLPAHFS